MSELGLPEDLDKRLQRQLLAMDPDEAEVYARLVSGVLDKLLGAAQPPEDPSGDVGSERMERAG